MRRLVQSEEQFELLVDRRRAGGALSDAHRGRWDRDTTRRHSRHLSRQMTILPSIDADGGGWPTSQGTGPAHEGTSRPRVQREGRQAASRSVAGKPENADDLRG